MSSRIGLLSLTMTATLLTGRALADEPKAPPAKESPAKARVEVVFCLDTTGSMSGLIDAAKKKIWTISNQIASGKPTPELKLGLVAYRDRGDAFVSQVFDLSNDLDAIYGHLMGFKADQGGDTPESVNKALSDAVTKINWSKDKNTLRMIFLVGDAAPHMDYKDDVQYPETCKEAAKRAIIINTVLCGRDASAKEHWLNICRLAEGSFVQIEQGGGPIVVVATPFDKELAEINTEMSRTTLVFGRRDVQEKGKALSERTAELAAPAAADRAAYYARGGGGVAYDLLQNIKDGKVKLEELKKDELPPELQGKTVAEQKTLLDTLDRRRQELSTRCLELDKKRGEFITKKLAEDVKAPGADSFDSQVLNILRTQAVRANIEYAIEPKDKK